jgi:hypothetical protein
LFSYFEILGSLIFFLSFWGSSNFFAWSFTSEEMGYVPFFVWILKFFHFHIFFNFCLVILEVFNFFMRCFTRGIGYLIFF